MQPRLPKRPLPAAPNAEETFYSPSKKFRKPGTRPPNITGFVKEKTSGLLSVASRPAGRGGREPARGWRRPCSTSAANPLATVHVAGRPYPDQPKAPHTSYPQTLRKLFAFSPKNFSPGGPPPVITHFAKKNKGVFRRRRVSGERDSGNEAPPLNQRRQLGGSRPRNRPPPPQSPKPPTPLRPPPLKKLFAPSPKNFLTRGPAARHNAFRKEKQGGCSGCRRWPAGAPRGGG